MLLMLGSILNQIVSIGHDTSSGITSGLLQWASRCDGGRVRAGCTAIGSSNHITFFHFRHSTTNETALCMYQDSMAICRHYSRADFFITFTCNLQWDEITANLPPGFSASD